MNLEKSKKDVDQMTEVNVKSKRVKELRESLKFRLYPKHM